MYRLLQRAHHVRVVGVVFATVHVFQQAALADRLTRQPGSFRQIQQILLEVFKASPPNAANRPLEAQAHDIIVQTDRFKQFRAAVRGDGGDAHFGHDFVQAFVDAVTVVEHHGTIIFGNRVGVYQAAQRFIGKVWINSRRAEAQQHGEVVRIAGAGGFDDDVGIATQALIDQTGLDRANRHRSRNRQAIFSDIPVGEHQQHGAATYHFFGFVAQLFDRRFERGFSDVKGDIQRICAVVLLFHRRELFEIGVEQNRRFKA